MAKVTIYTGFMCGFCARAKYLLARKGVQFDEINITMDSAARDEMIERAVGARTVPQIFIDGQHIGGSDELAALEKNGKLDELLYVDQAQDSDCAI